MVCLHKRLWPLLPQDVLFFVVIFVVAFLAGAPGIGGGGINVPLLMMINRFSIKEAVPLSHIAVMGNALSQLLVNTQLPHPSSAIRPLVNYEVACLLLPAMLGGSSLGVVVGKIFPSTLLIVLSLVLLSLTTVKTTLKAYHLSQKSLEGTSLRGAGRDVALRNLPDPSDLAFDEAAPSFLSDSVLVPGGFASPTSRARRNAIREPGEQLLQPGKMQIPWQAIYVMMVFNVLFCADYLILAKDVSGVDKCTPVYWLALVGLYPAVLLSLVFAIRLLKQREPLEGDPEMTGATLVVFPVAAVLVGLLAGLLGLGGGEFLVPLLLELGLQPRVAAATSGFLIFFSTSSNVVHYLLAGTMEPFLGYGIGCFVCAMLGSLAGLFVGQTKYVKDHGYMIIFLVAFLLALSAVLLVARGLLNAEVSWAFRAFCSS